MSEILLFALAGFLAQIIDGTLGMAFGLSASSLLQFFGVAPAVASATVHAAEVFTTGASAVSHHHFGNIDRALFRRLVIPGVLGAVLGSYILASLHGEALRPFISAYLFVMGVVIVTKAFRQFPSKRVTGHIAPLGFVGAFIDTIGGGGWGPIVASNLIARGNETRSSVGTVNAAEFFVTLASTITFFATLGLSHWRVIAGLAIGGMLAAPFGAYLCKRVPTKPLMILVGCLIMVLSVITFAKVLLR